MTFFNPTMTTTAIGQTLVPQLNAFQIVNPLTALYNPAVSIGGTYASTASIALRFMPQGVHINTPVAGNVVLDTGRNLTIANGGAILDHHQLTATTPSAAESAASLVLKHANQVAGLAADGLPLTLVAHSSPDLDAVTALAVASRILHGGVAALPPAAADFVDYVRLDDNAAFGRSDADPTNSLSLIILTYFERISQLIAAECVSAYNAEHPDAPIQGVWQLPPAEKARYQFLADHCVARLGMQLVLDLIDSGYDPKTAGGEMRAEMVPERWRAALEESRAALASDAATYQDEKKSFTRFTATLPPREGEVWLALSHNTRSQFFPYLYAEGFVGGVIYHDAKDPAIGKVFPGARVVIAVKPETGINLSDLAGKLNAAERDKRLERGLSLEIKGGDQAFFKVVSNGTLIVTHGSRTDPGMIALTEEEIQNVIMFGTRKGRFSMERRF
jgi:hypothetical protein